MDGSIAASAATRRCSACATATARASVPVRYVGAVPDPFRDGREVIVTVRKQGAVVRGREGLAGDEVPVEVHRQAGRRRPERHGPRRPGLPDPRPRACAYGIGASLYGARTGRRDWVDSGRRAVYALARADDARPSWSSRSPSCARTSTSTSSPRTRRRRRRPSTGAAAWSSQEGSLLLWVWLLSLWSSLVLFLVRRRLRDVAPYATAVLLGFGAFFTGAARLRGLAVRTRGAGARRRAPGLNPLLRHPSMMIHPPMLYSGYTLFAVPVRVRDRRAGRAARRRRVDPRDAPLRAGGLVLPRRRDPARRALVLRRAGLGRLLGLGPGRERLAAAVADRHRVPALGDDAGEARDAEGLERLADPRDRHARGPRHLPRALGDPRLDPRLRRLDARACRSCRSSG